MGYNKNPRKCRKCGKEVTMQNSRHCEFCATHRTCTHCKELLHISEFSRTIKESKGNLGMCKKCTDFINNYRKCIHCKKYYKKEEFIKGNNLCKKCNQEKKEKFGFRRCKKCEQVKENKEFDYKMRTCRICDEIEKNKLREIEENKKKVIIKFCKYCNKEINPKFEFCEECKNTKKFKVKVNCKKCKKEVIIESRYKNKIHSDIVCQECKEKREQELLDIGFVTCKFCNKNFSFLSKRHIEKCSNYQISYEDYKNQFGLDSIYSKYYKETIKKSQKPITEEIRKKLSEANSRYFKNNREIVLKRTENMRNSPKRLQNLLKNYENMSKEEKIKRSEAASKSWKNEKIRKNRIIGLKSEKSVESRKKNIRKCLQTQQPIISKPARELFNYLVSKGFKVIIEYKVEFYSLDIAIPEEKICIEVDGDWWHGNPKIYKELNKNQIKRRQQDKAKNTFLSNKGWKVFRYWVSDLQKSKERVFEDISNTLRSKRNV